MLLSSLQIIKFTTNRFYILLVFYVMLINNALFFSRNSKHCIMIILFSKMPVYNSAKKNRNVI